MVPVVAIATLGPLGYICDYLPPDTAKQANTMNQSIVLEKAFQLIDKQTGISSTRV